MKQRSIDPLILSKSNLEPLMTNKPSFDINLPSIHINTNKIPIKRTPSVGSLNKKPQRILETIEKNDKTQTHFDSIQKSSINSYRDPSHYSQNVRISTPELKRNLKNLSENDWKTSEKTRFKEKLREKSILSSLDKPHEQKSSIFEITQHNISKFYLEYHNSHHPNRAKLLTKPQISDLLGINEFGLNADDTRLKEIIENYPNASFLDLSQMNVMEKEVPNALSKGSLTSKFRNFLLKEQDDGVISNNSISKTNKSFINKESFNVSKNLEELQHRTQNNPEKYPSKRQGILEMAYWLDKVSQEISSKNNDDLDMQLISMQNASRVCIQSISNEIAKECKERGVLLAMIWDLNMDWLNAYIKRIEKSSKDMQGQLVKNIIDVKAVYQDKYNELQEKIIELQNSLEGSKEIIKRNETDSGFYKEKTIHLERVVKLLDHEFSELKMNFEKIFLENLKFKLNKLEDLPMNSFHKAAEKEIFKKAFDEMTKNQILQEQQLGIYVSNDLSMGKVESTYKKLISGELNINDLKETTGRFMMQMTNLSFNILELPKKLEDYLIEDSPENVEIKGFFNKDIAVDTIDLIQTQEKAIDSNDFYKVLMRDNEAQTVLIDEILDDMSPGNNDPMLASDILYGKRIKLLVNNNRLNSPNSTNMVASDVFFQRKIGSNNSLSPLLNHQNKTSGFGNIPLGTSPLHTLIKKRIFNFNQETLNNLDKISEINTFSISKLIDFYSNEMQLFYKVILDISEEIINSNENSNIDWFGTHETILNNKGLHEQFIGLIYDRDKKKINEIINQKIEIIQRKLDFEEIEKNHMKLQYKFNGVSRRFNEFFNFIIQEETEKMLENEENLNSDGKNLENSLKTMDKPIVPIKSLKRKKKSKILDDSELDRVNLLKKILSNNQPNPTLIKKRSSFVDGMRRNNTYEDITYEMNTIQPTISNNIHKFQETVQEMSERKTQWLNDAYNALPQNKITLKVQSQHYQNCTMFQMKIKIFLEKHQNSFSDKNMGGISLNMIIKTISSLFVEFLKRVSKMNNENLYLNPLFYIFYEYMFNRHSLSKENTESRIFNMIQSCMFYKEIPRIRIFLKLLGILQKADDFYIIDGSDLLFYLDCISQLDDIIINDIEFNKTKNDYNGNNNRQIVSGICLLLTLKESVKIGLNKAIEIIRKFFKNTMVSDSYNIIKLEDIINKIKAIKCPDPLISRKYVVDVDFVIEQMFWIRSEGYMKYRRIFMNLDLDKKEALNLKEFLFLLKNIETSKNSEELKVIFKRESDFVDDEKFDCIGFKKFAVICERNQWLLNKTLEKFEKNVTDDIINIENLMNDWEIKKNLIKLKFIKTNNYNSFFNRVLKKIEEFIVEKKKKDMYNKKELDEIDKKIWLLYRLLDDESNGMLLDFETQTLIVKELTDIAEITRKIIS